MWGLLGALAALTHHCYERHPENGLAGAYEEAGDIAWRWVKRLYMLIFLGCVVVFSLFLVSAYREAAQDKKFETCGPPDKLLGEALPH